MRLSSARVIRVLLLLCILVVASQPAEPAQAGGTLWCKADPVVSLDGRLVDITVSIPLEFLPYVAGPTQIQIRTPAGVERVVVLNDLGFNLHGSEVTFVDGGVVKDDLIPVEVRVTVPMQLDSGERAPMEVMVWPDNKLPTTVVGTNELTSLRLHVERQTVLYSE